jgi:predicted nuclease of predicted toxin-antitoxin system
MTVWIDAQITPALAGWLAKRFHVSAYHVRDLDLVAASDPGIFDAAGLAGAVVITKDRDFVELVRRCGSPPPKLPLRRPANC